MKSLLMAALAALLWIPPAPAQVPAGKTVYLLPMAGGLDQYLALRLTSAGVLQVATDPQKADVILTDRIGSHFAETLTELYGPSPEKDKSSADFARPGMQPLSRSRGVIFLVDRGTGNVVWSTFEQTRNSTPDELNHAAERIVERLAKAQKGK